MRWNSLRTVHTFGSALNRCEMCACALCFFWNHLNQISSAMGRQRKQALNSCSLKHTLKNNNSIEMFLGLAVKSLRLCNVCTPVLCKQNIIFYPLICRMVQLSWASSHNSRRVTSRRLFPALWRIADLQVHYHHLSLKWTIGTQSTISIRSVNGPFDR